MDDSLITLRAFDREQDEALIYASWRSGSYFGTDLVIGEVSKESLKLSQKEKKEKAALYFSQKTKEIKEILDSAKVAIACKAYTTYFLLGYSVSTKDHLDWIFVKSIYRKSAIGDLLLPNSIKTYSQTLTDLGKELAVKKNLTFKGESNGNSTRENR